MKAIDRIYQYLEFKGIKVSEFERTTGLSNGYLGKMKRREADIGESNMIQMLENCPDISPTWLLTGEGNMLKKEAAAPAEISAIEPQTNTNTAPAITTKLIPLVAPTAVAGFGNENFAIAEADIKEYYVVPKFKYSRVDFMIEISGSSMYPKYNSGDVVACTILRDSSFIQWNKCHVVATREQGLLCKRLMQSDIPNALRLVSDNPSYPPFDVPKEEITGIALVIGVIRLE